MSAFPFIYLHIGLHPKVFVLLFLYFICTSLFLSTVKCLERKSLDCLSNDSMNISYGLHPKVFVPLFLYFICPSLFLSTVQFLERKSLDCLSNDSMNIS